MLKNISLKDAKTILCISCDGFTGKRCDLKREKVCFEVVGCFVDMVLVVVDVLTVCSFVSADLLETNDRYSKTVALGAMLNATTVD